MPDPQHRSRSLAFHPNAPAIVRFDAFRFDLTDGSLWRDGAEVRLPPRALVILQHLVERAGRVVSKQALIDAAWKEAYVGDASLTEAIGIIRQALGDDPQEPRFIQTVYRRGYRFVAPIATDAPSATASVPTVVAGPAPNRAEPDRDAPESIDTETSAAHAHLSAATSAHASAQASASAVAYAPASAPATTASAAARHLPPLAWIALGVVTLVAIGGVIAVVWASRAPVPPAPTVRLNLTLPPDEAPAPGANAHPVAAISPDGTRVIYTAGPTGASRLFVRRMDQFAATPLTGTTVEGHGPFVSPDGKWVAFFGDGHLKKVPLDGGEPQVLCKVPTGVGGVWLNDDEIVFAPDWTTGLLRVSASGGEPTMAATPPTGRSYRWPDRVDGHTVVATRWRATARDAAVVLIDLTSGRETVLAERAVFGRYVAATGHVIVVRDNAMFAVRLDPATHAVIGQPVQVNEAVLTGTTGAAQIAIAPNGTLLYIPDDEARTHRVLARTDLAGRATDLPIAARNFRNLAVCNDRIALTIFEHGQSDLWMGQLDRAPLTRLTSEGSVYDPIWTTDCETLTFAWNRTGFSTLHDLAVGAGSPPTRRPENPPTDSATRLPGSWSADKRLFTFLQVDPKTGADMWLADLAAKTTRPVGPTAGMQVLPRLSPDGRFLAYESDTSGQFEIEVLSIATGARVQVSTGGGIWPAWSLDGRQLFYLDDGTIYRLTVQEGGVPDAAPASTGARATAGAGLTFTNPVAAFAHPDVVLFRPARVAGGDGFVVVRRIGEHLPLTRLDLVLNWFGELQSRAR